MSLKNNLQTYNCKICGDIGYKTAKTASGNDAVAPCICLLRKTKAAVFGDLFEEKTIDNYEGRNASMREAKRTIEKNPKGSYYIFGPVGTGKTHLLAGLYEKLYDANIWLSTIVMTETQLIEAVKGDVLFNRMKSAKVIILDDMGKIKLAAWDIEKLFNFYNDIYRFETRLIISSNYSLPQIAEYYGGAITRRIEERCEILEIKGAE